VVHKPRPRPSCANIRHVVAALLVTGALAGESLADQFTLGVAVDVAADGVTEVHAADLDGDGDLDVLWSAFAIDTVAWHENLDGLGTYGPAQTITTTSNGVGSACAADLDGDDDLDVVTGAFGDDTVAWHENLDGLGTFGPRQVITTLTNSPWQVIAADVDGDLDTDVLSASIGDDVFAWYENTDGLGSFGPQQVIETQTNGPWAIVAADLDGDLDQDVISVSRLDDKVAWYRNIDGLGNFGREQLITTDADDAQAAFAADLDGDGDLDVISGSVRDDKVAWYENTDGLGNFGPEQVISVLANEVRAVYAADLDGDDDVDVLSASSKDDLVGWYENLDGAGSFGPVQVISMGANEAQWVETADLDGDGDQDVLSGAASEVRWYDYQDLLADWTDLGGGTFGLFGPPTLRVLSEPLAAGATVDMQLVKARGNRRMLAMFSTASTPVPVVGGTFFANPVALALSFGSNESGMWSWSTVVPPGVPPGTDLYMQFVIDDDIFSVPFTMSNAVTATTP